MKLLALPQEPRFTNKQIIAFLLPIFFEQMMLAGLGVADNSMVSHLGEEVLAGVSLVSRIDVFVKSFLLALAQGGSVVLSQYIGAKNDNLACLSMRNNIRMVTFLSCFIMLIMVCFRSGVLTLLFGQAESDVIEVSNSYFMITALSYPFVGLYYSCSSSFRAMGESKIPSFFSVLMMVINLTFKYLFIFKFGLGEKGAALSTLLAMAITGISMLIVLHGKKNKIPLSGLFTSGFGNKNVKRILAVSIPNGFEQAMFQLGALLIAGLVSGLGTAAIAADSVARSITPLIHSLGTSFTAVAMMLIGQCMGAGKSDEAKFYTRHILKLDYLLTFINFVIFILILSPSLSLFGEISDEAKDEAFKIMLLYSGASVLFYPSSFALAGALRGTGDTKFVMMVASLSMFIFRIGAAYFFAKGLNMGIFGTWLAMVSDWVIRTIIFTVRFKQGKWVQNKVI